MSRLLAVTAGKSVGARVGAVANAMANLLTVVAFDYCTISVLLLLLGAGLEYMSKLIAVATLGDAAVNSNTCICQTLVVFLC